ncbi:ABC transporter permease [Acidisoma silvae]|uniref:ABC transporter permease n=1 Tax=Acidisoma silvae TaxID=2802396 RepID=A0A964E1B3_9PROT|nr:ABC transporter permease [Acidisoma silvae]MCB8878042.1 ABC transporter permease [Acidisoma silvae]
MTGMSSFRRWTATHSWIWSFLGAGALMIVMLPFLRGQGIEQVGQVAIQFATFYVMVGLGQMLVIALGSGNIDLSVPGTITLAGFVGLSVSSGATGTLGACGAAVAIGIGAGIGNAVLIQVLQIPPMIATLSSGFVLQSLAIAFSRGASAVPSPLLQAISVHRFAGVPDLAIILILASLTVGLVLRQTRFGRTVLASGQSIRAARLTGLSVNSTIAIVYILSGIFAALTGLFLAASVGGASLDMGQEYLLFSIAVVVLGGTAISGGEASPTGVWGAALLLVLSVTLLNILGVGAGVRFLATGIIIVGVLGVTKPRED